MTITSAPQSIAPSVRYVISDNNARETADTIQEAVDIVEEWYDRWHRQIAELQGYSDFSGHGNYHVSAADQAGLSLTVEVEAVLGRYVFATDSESGTIEAKDFADACQQLEEMFSPESIEDGAWGWVQDVDGTRYRVAP